MSMMTTDNFCFYLQNRLIQTKQTGGQQYSDTFPLVFPEKCNRTHAVVSLGDSSQLFDCRPYKVEGSNQAVASKK